MSFKVTLDEKSVKNCEQVVRDAFAKVIANKQMLNEIGEIMVKDIQYQTRRGQSIPLKEKLKPLSDERHPFLYGIYGRLDFSTAKTKKKKDALLSLRGQQAEQGYNYIEIRKYISQSTNTHPAFSPARSNLTLTGQLLNSLKSIIKGPGKIEIKAEGDHDPYKIRTSRGTRTIGKKIKNEDLAVYVAEQGRKFIGLRDEMKPRIRKVVLGFIRRSSRVLNLFNINER